MGASLRLLSAEGVVVEGGERLLEGLERGHAVVGHAVGVLVRQLVGAQHVAPAEVGGVDPGAAGGDVQEDLAGQRLELPRPPIRSAPGGVGVDRLGCEARLRHPVGAGEDRPDGRRRHNRPRRRVSATVLGVVDLDGLDDAVRVERHRDVCVFVTGRARGEQVLAPVLDPLQRGGHLRRGQHQAHLVALDHHLLAEAAAGVAGDDADALLGHAQQPGAEQTDLVRHLGGGVDRQLLAVRRVIHDEPPPLHRHRRVALLGDHFADDVCGGREGLVEQGGRHARQFADEIRAVCLVHEVSGVLGLPVVDDRRERVVVDVDEVGGVLGDVTRVGHDEGDGIAGEAGLCLGERGPRRLRAVGSHRRVPLLFHVDVEVGGGLGLIHIGAGE